MPGEPDFAAEAAPEKIVAAVADQVAAAGGSLPHTHHEGAHPEAVSVRKVNYRGHDILIRTRYEIEVDGRPFAPAVTVDLGGRVHYHGLPTRDFSSMVDLVRKAIDTFPEDFAPAAADGPGADPGHDVSARAGHHHTGRGAGEAGQR